MASESTHRETTLSLARHYAQAQSGGWPETRQRFHNLCEQMLCGYNDIGQPLYSRPHHPPTWNKYNAASCWMREAGAVDHGA